MLDGNTISNTEISRHKETNSKKNLTKSIYNLQTSYAQFTKTLMFMDPCIII